VHGELSIQIKPENIDDIVKILSMFKMADGVGFEPTMGFHPCRFSRPVHSTALPPIRVGNRISPDEKEIKPQSTNRCGFSHMIAFYA
jgi:hypothetical protein